MCANERSPSGRRRRPSMPPRQFDAGRPLIPAGHRQFPASSRPCAVGRGDLEILAQSPPTRTAPGGAHVPAIGAMCTCRDGCAAGHPSCRRHVILRGRSYSPHGRDGCRHEEGGRRCRVARCSDGDSPCLRADAPWRKDFPCVAAGTVPARRKFPRHRASNCYGLLTWWPGTWRSTR